MVKIRLDKLLVQKGLYSNIIEAQSAIMSGIVFACGNRADKAGMQCKSDTVIELKTKEHPYVSRGGLKLQGALDYFNINLEGNVALDIGSSTGGFTDCMLLRGAKSVVDVDVGRELAWKLRCDSRVKVMERTNIRNCKKTDFDTEFDFITVDVSFISLKIVLPVMEDVLKPEGRAICLVKPQFEASRSDVGEGGIVTSPETHKKVLAQFIENASKYFKVNGIIHSSIKGMKGNIEFLALLSRNGQNINLEEVDKIVADAHTRLFNLTI